MPNTKTNAIEPNDTWTDRDTITTILVGLFWFVAVIIVCLEKKISTKKKLKIIGSGTVLAIFVSLLFNAITS